MAKHEKRHAAKFGQIKTAGELGDLIRSFRKGQQLTLEKVSGLSNLSMRFLSELERGKNTAELGKVLTALNKLGLDLLVLPRGYEQQVMRQIRKIQAKDNDDDK